ncbi:hypothetical protein VitviT2T_013086 [Vitis vinifera]|uniref:Uncharacterized protein n=1 Tax=Vitis vinifera TaxID=29760 RepID=A0ABY9CI75_VITVI|nr:hypothetical protein VitviT2T_013086 [Vitis vinifera]
MDSTTTLDSKTEPTVQQKESVWMKNPKTGNWIPEAHFGDTDLEALREKQGSEEALTCVESNKQGTTRHEASPPLHDVFVDVLGLPAKVKIECCFPSTNVADANLIRKPKRSCPRTPPAAKRLRHHHLTANSVQLGIKLGCGIHFTADSVQLGTKLSYGIHHCQLSPDGYQIQLQCLFLKALRGVVDGHHHQICHGRGLGHC